MNTAPKVEYIVVRANAAEPRYMSAGSAGADLFACLDEAIILEPKAFATIPTGIAMAIPVGWEGEVRPRSGLASRFGVTVLNAPGTIDSDYRGEVKVILINHGRVPLTINSGDRIAQILIKPAIRANYVVSSELDKSERGEGGFGSTGK